MQAVALADEFASNAAAAWEFINIAAHSPRLTTEATFSPAPCQSARLNSPSIIRSVLLVKGRTKTSRERC
jgi:hypothetical protein